MSRSRQQRIETARALWRLAQDQAGRPEGDVAQRKLDDFMHKHKIDSSDLGVWNKTPSYYGEYSYRGDDYEPASKYPWPDDVPDMPDWYGAHRREEESRRRNSGNAWNGAHYSGDFSEKKTRPHRGSSSFRDEVDRVFDGMKRTGRRGR